LRKSQGKPAFLRQQAGVKRAKWVNFLKAKAERK
jgi:hypothetical protein